MNPPLAPLMITPNRYLTNVTEPLLSWNETINAEKYQIQISPYYTFTSVLQDVIVPDQGTSFTTATLEEGLYYWRVRGIDSVGVNGAWSRYRSFRIDTTPPASPPALDLPLDGVFTDITTPTLTVIAVSDAFEYCFQLDDSVTFDDTLVNPACDSRTTNTSWTVPVEAMLGYQTYYWRAMAIDAAGNISGASTARRLNLSIVQTPADSSFSSITTPEFLWIAHPEAINYHLQVSTTPDFVPETENLIDEQLNSTVFLATTELDYSTYYLRLEVDTGTGFTGSWMPVQKFTVSPVPETPVPLIPVNGVFINDKTPLLSWSEVVDPVIPVNAYEIQVSTDTAFSSFINTGIAAGSPTYETGELLDGQYYWRVRAVNDLGAPGAWSSTANFWLDATPVNAPPYYSPASGATVTTTTPKLTVKKVSGAASYRFQVASEPTFADPLLVDKLGTVGLRTVSYTLAAAEALPFGPVYWRAATVDSIGNEAWGEARPLVINILKTPKHGATTTDSTPTFTWVGVAGALKYEIQVATTASFEAGSITSYIVYPPVTSYSPGSEMAGGNYYWRMRVDNWTGFTDNWTPAFSFLVSPLIPSTPSLMGPPSGSYLSDDSPKMRWVETFKVYAPQLRIKTRTIQVYLPPDYATSGKSYPVIYLNDGNTKFISGYYVDDTLEDLYNSGQIEGVIAVAIFNSSNRWDEYAPNVNTHMDDVWFAYGAASSEGGEGNRYVDFLVDTLKPMIDSHYRTLPGREYTAVGAGSMGGYISLYAALREPDVFSKVMALSPAVWFGESGGAWLSNNFLIKYIKNHPGVYNNTQFFLYTGTSEWSGRRLNLSGMTYPKVWVQGVRAVQNALLDSGVPADKIHYIENPGGIHSSYSWRWWVDEAVTWFYGDLDELPDSPPEDKPDSSFKVQISSDSRFTTIVHEGVTLDGQLNYEGVTLGQGRYYWRVQTVNNAGITGSWSQTRYFDIDTEPTEPPNLYQPGDNGFSYDRTPSLSVRSVSGAYQYCFQVADSPAFDNILVNPDCALRSSRTSWSVPSADQLSYGEDYYWRALAIDRAGNQSGWSDSRELTISIMKSPVDHANTTDTTPTFKWSSITGGQMYHLQVDTDPEFNSNPLVLDIARSPSTYYTPTTPFAAGKYYWRMRVMISGTYGDWMPVQTFTISPIPAAPRLTAPGSGTLTKDKTPLLSWDAVVDPAIIGYQVQSSRSSLFTNSTLEQVTGVTTYESTAITDDGRYYWRVRAVNDLGVAGTWSSTRSIVIDTTPPNTPSLVIPLDGATVNGLPFYYWFSDITAKYHQFEFATDPGFTNIEYRTGELTVPYHILPGQKPGMYYWHTRARDAAGNWSDWSESRQVTIAP